MALNFLTLISMNNNVSATAETEKGHIEECGGDAEHAYDGVSIFRESGSEAANPPILSVNEKSLFVSCPKLEASLKETTILSSKRVKKGPAFYDEIRLNKRHTLFKIETPEALAERYSVNLEEVNKISEATDGIIELYSLFQCANSKSHSWLQQNRYKEDTRYVLSLATSHCRYKTIHRLLMLSKLNGLGTWVKFLKWKFASYFSYYMEEDIPVKPDFKWPERHNRISAFFSEKVLLGGYLEDLICSLKLKRSGKFFKRSQRLSFLISTQQLKKVMPSVPKSMIDESVMKTVEELSTSKPLSDDISVKYPLGMSYENFVKCEDSFFTITKEKMEEQLRRTVTELFFGKFISEEELFEPFFPSTSANYINSRGECGSLNVLYDQLSLGKEGCDLIDFGIELLPLTDEVASRFGLQGESDQRKIDALKEAGMEQAAEFGVLRFDASQLKEVWKNQYIRLYELALEEKPYVLAIGLSEPLKVRVISKGPPLLYTFLKPFQKWMWKVLKSNRVFSLIGRYVTEDDINRCLGTPVDWEEQISGDYVSSTNKVRSWAAEVMIDQLMIEFGEAIPSNLLNLLPLRFMSNLKLLFLRAMTKHIFDISKMELKPSLAMPWTNEEMSLYLKNYLLQKEGQLMGSIISFIFLCMINASGCRYSIELSYGLTRQFRLTDAPYPGSGDIAPTLINGDDCLLKGLEGLRQIWEAVCKYVGLESSVGKTYFSKSFCTINSTTFVWDVKEQRWIEHKYINLGLMKGLQRTKGKTEKVISSMSSPQVGIHQLGTICRELKRSCPPESWDLVKSRFIYYNKKTLESYEGGLPWFLPEWLGGVGLPLDKPNELSDLDRRTATVLKMYHYKRDFNIIKPKDMDTWLMHKKVQKDLKPFGLSEVHYRTVHMDGPHSLEEEYNNLYKLMTFNLLEKESLENLWTDVKKDKSVVKSIRSNIKSIGRARREVSNNFALYQPMCDEDLLFENKKLVIPCLSLKIKNAKWMAPYWPSGEDKW
jgi:hypothetical protein